MDVSIPHCTCTESDRPPRAARYRSGTSSVRACRSIVSMESKRRPGDQGGFQDVRSGGSGRAGLSSNLDVPRAAAHQRSECVANASARCRVLFSHTERPALQTERRAVCRSIQKWVSALQGAHGMCLMAGVERVSCGHISIGVGRPA